MYGSPDFLGGGKEGSGSTPTALAPAWAQITQCGCNNGAISLSPHLSLLSELVLTKAGQLDPTPVPQCVSHLLSCQMYEKSQTQMLFLWEDFTWWMLGRSADSLRLTLEVFSEHWMLYLFPLVELQCCHWDFQLYHCHFTLWRNNNCLINVTFLGLSFIVSKSPLRNEVVICVHYTYVSFVVPLHSQRPIKICMNIRPPV